MVFLDQSGYSAIAIGLVAKIMRVPQCEVFSLLEYREIDRFLSDPAKHAGLDHAFGGDEWRSCASLPGPKRTFCFRDTYVKALRGRGGAKYVVTFTMHDLRGRVLYSRISQMPYAFLCTGYGVESVE